MSRKKCKVIIAMTTYNLQDYVQKAIESIMNQKVTFDYKLIVADDCSTDNTIKILKELKSQYKSKIELILNKENLGSLANSNQILNNIDCEYFSFIDGDDYWVTEDRLQRQVDYLDKHPECSMCGGNTVKLKNNELRKNMIKDEYLDRKYSFEDLINNSIPFVHTSSILFRNSIFKDSLPKEFIELVGTFEECAVRGEDFRRLLHLEKGYMYIFKDIFSVYRIHSQGIWQGSSELRRQLETAITDNFYYKYYKEKYPIYFGNRFLNSYQALLKNITLNKRMFPYYNIDKKDTFLFTSLLLDINDSDYYKYFEKEKGFLPILTYFHTKIKKIVEK